MDIKPKINWFPGHMKRATDEIAKQIKNVDFLIEVLDARAVTATHNPELCKFNKPVLQIALKSDLALPPEVPNNVLTGTTKEPNFRTKIIAAIDALMAQKRQNLVQKGLKNPKFLGMVVGLPNVGKSTLINFLKQKKQLVSENRPGVTKKQAIVQIDHTYSLIDTPGVLFKNLPDQEQAYQLILIQCIKPDVTPLDPVLTYAFKALTPEKVCAFYNLPVTDHYHVFLNELCQKYKFLAGGNLVDEDRGQAFFFRDITSGKITKLNWDNW